MLNVLHCKKAAFYTKLKKGDKLDVKTLHVVASVRGTEFLAHTAENRSSISVISGRVHTRDHRGNNLELNSDSYAVIDKEGYIEVGKGRHVQGITGEVKTEKGSKVKAAKKSSADEAVTAKKKARKERKNKVRSQKVTSDQSIAGRDKIGKSKAAKEDTGKVNRRGKKSGRGKADRSEIGKSKAEKADSGKSKRGWQEFRPWKSWPGRNRKG